MRQAIVDGLARTLARRRPRGGRLGSAVTGMTLLLAGVPAGRSPIEPGSADPVCGDDWPTGDSVDAASAAWAQGTRDVALSPGGCVRLQQSPGRGLTRTTISFAGLTAWRAMQLVDGAAVVEEHGEPGGPTSARVTYPPATRTPYSVTREEADPGTGALTERATTTTDGAVVHVRLERPDDTGTLQTFALYDTAAEQEVGTSSGPAGRPPTGGAAPQSASASCTPEQQQYLAGLFPLAVGRGLDCLKRYGASQLVALISQVMTTRGVTFTCLTSPSPAHPGALAWVPSDSWATWGSRLRVFLEPNFFIVDSDEASAALFHELLHTRMGWNHHPDEDAFPAPKRVEADRVRACTSLCFGLDVQDPAAPSRCACATCLGTTSCDDRCSGLSDCDPGLSFQCPCPSGSHKYKRFDTCAQCLAVCPSGLACFGYLTCDVVGDVSCGSTRLTCP